MPKPISAKNVVLDVPSQVIRIFQKISSVVIKSRKISEKTILYHHRVLSSLYVTTKLYIGSFPPQCPILHYTTWFFSCSAPHYQMQQSAITQMVFLRIEISVHPQSVRWRKLSSQFIAVNLLAITWKGMHCFLMGLESISVSNR